MVLMWAMTSLSKHFMATDVSATGWSSFRQVTLVFLGTGTVIVLKTCWYYRLGQGEDENVSEECLQYTPW